GLVAAAYLARAGLTTVVCERRAVTGGAAVSEHPFGPDYTVTSLSYVVSLLPPDLVRDLRLEQHGYLVYPQGPYFAPRTDGRYLRLPHDPAQRHAEIARFSAADADAYPRYEEHLAGIGGVLGPLLHQIPPRLGSRRPQDLLRHGRGVGRAGPGRPDVRRADQDRRRGGADPDLRRPGHRGHAGQRGGHRRAGGRHDRAPADLVPAAARPGRAASRVRRRHPRL